MYERLTSENTTKPVIVLVSLSEENRVVIFKTFLHIFYASKPFDLVVLKDHGNIGIEHRQTDVKCGKIFLKCRVQ